MANKGVLATGPGLAMPSRVSASDHTTQKNHSSYIPFSAPNLSAYQISSSLLTSVNAQLGPFLGPCPLSYTYSPVTHTIPKPLVCSQALSYCHRVFLAMKTMKSEGIEELINNNAAGRAAPFGREEDMTTIETSIMVNVPVRTAYN